MPQLLPSEGAGVAAAAKEVWRDNFLTANPWFTGDTLRENCHITQYNLKSREFYGRRDLGFVMGFDSLQFCQDEEQGIFQKDINAKISLT